MDLSGWLDPKAKGGAGRFKPYNMRYVSLESWPANEKPTRCTAANRAAAMTRLRDEYLIQCPFRSVGLLRRLVQQRINRDISEVLQRYHRQFLEPVLANVRENLGPDSSLAEQLDGNAFMYQVLEEAKKLFPVDKDNLCLAKLCGTQTSGQSTIGDSINEPGSSTDHHPTGGLSAPPPPAPSRPRGRPSNSAKKAAKKAKAVKVKRKRRNLINQQQHQYETGSKASGNDDETSISMADNTDAMIDCWDPSRLTTDTLFVLGSRANKALGFGAARGRLYSKHSNLFRYIGDHEDKEWLHRNQLMPPTGGKAYLLLRQDIVRLMESDEYRGMPGVNISDMGEGFTVPQSMVDKIIATMQNRKKSSISSSSSSSSTQPIITDGDCHTTLESNNNTSSSSSTTTTLLDS